MSDQVLLPELLRRESRSLLQYVREAYPWSSVKDLAGQRNLLSGCEAENELLAQLGRLMQKQHLPMPALGAFPTSFTSMNYVSMSFLVPRLIAAERQSLADLERDLPKVKDEQIRVVSDVLRELKRRHLADMESLAGTATAAWAGSGNTLRNHDIFHQFHRFLRPLGAQGDECLVPAAANGTDAAQIDVGILEAAHDPRQFARPVFDLNDDHFLAERLNPLAASMKPRHVSRSAPQSWRLPMLSASSVSIFTLAPASTRSGRRQPRSVGLHDRDLFHGITFCPCFVRGKASIVSRVTCGMVMMCASSCTASCHCKSRGDGRSKTTVTEFACRRLLPAARRRSSA